MSGPAAKRIYKVCNSWSHLLRQLFLLQLTVAGYRRAIYLKSWQNVLPQRHSGVSKKVSVKAHILVLWTPDSYSQR